MMRNMTRSLFGSLAFLLLVAASATPAPDASRSAEAPGLAAGEALVLATADGSGLVLAPTENPVIRFVEVEGAEVVVRLTPIDRTGMDLGSGRVIVVGASEQREVRLREELTPEALDGVKLRVEALQGGGRLLVYTPAGNGSGLRLQQPAATPGRRRAVVRPPPTPTSLTLIDAAEASGALNGETALLYRVYALFSDARLPAQYRGDDSRIEDSLYMAEVRDRFATLSPATQAAVLPFLTPPAYQGSWANAATGSSLTILATPPPCDFFSDRWGFVEPTNTPVRVWYRPGAPGDFARANDVALSIDTTIWPKLAGLMTTAHLPLSDQEKSCNGGNGRLDVYLVDAARSLTTPYSGCSNSPVFILLKRTSSNALAAHEIFHAMQYSFPLAGCMADKAKYRWWAEASAEWAMDFVFPSDPEQPEHKSAPFFLDVPEKSLDLPEEAHEYGAYLLPFYLHRKTRSANFVRASWENCKNQSALEAVDAAIPGGFEAVWPDFARFNWNRKPVEDYTTWDGLKSQASPAGGGEIEVRMGGSRDIAMQLKVDLPRLSTTYKHFNFTDDSARSIAFWNGATFNLKLEELLPIGIQYKPDTATADEKLGARVQALIKLRGQDWQVADWTNVPYMTFCRDMLSERIDELVLIISNSEFKNRDRKLQPPGLAPVLFASNMGCYQWKGTTSYTSNLSGLTTIITADATFTREATSQSPPFVTYKATGTGLWSVSGECAGSGNFQIEPQNSVLLTYNYTPTEGTFHRTYAGGGSSSPPGRLTCRGGATVPFAGGSWLTTPAQPFLPGIPETRFLYLDATGTLMIDSYKPLGGGEWRWRLESQRQP
jgi:hypothetical protein